MKLGLSQLSLTHGRGLLGVSVTLPAIPASAEVVVSPVGLSSLSGVTQLEDLSGNNRPLVFGSTAPTLGTDSRSGLKYLSFTRAVTDPCTISNFFTDISAGVNDNYVYIVALRITDENNAVSGRPILGDSGLNRYLRVINDTFSDASTGASPVPVNEDTNYKADRYYGADLRLQVSQQIGSDATIYGFTDDPFYGEDALGNEDDLATVTRTRTNAPTGDLIFNGGLHGVQLYGFMYLRNPTQEQRDEGVAFALRNWMINPDKRSGVLMLQGDSLIEVPSSAPTRTPGWALINGDTNGLDESKLILNFANAGRRVRTGAPLQDNLWDGEPYSIAVRYAKALAQSMPGKTDMLLLGGHNDLVADSIAPATVQSEIERYATEFSGYGVRMIWGTTGFTFDANRTTVTENIRDRQVAGTNDFSITMDVLENDVNFQWGRDNATAVPALFADAVHPSTAGNADIATKVESFLTGL